MKRGYKLFIEDIISAIESIESFVEDMSYDDFIVDDKTSSAVIRKFEIIGEATKHIPDWIKDKYPEIPWKYMAGMRDRLIHGYFGIDYKLVWNTIKVDLPNLRIELERVLNEIE